MSLPLQRCLGVNIKIFFYMLLRGNWFFNLSQKFKCFVSLFKPMWPSARLHMLNNLALKSWSCYLTRQENFSILKTAKGRRWFNSFDLQHFSGIFCFEEALIHSFKAVCGNLCVQGWKGWAVMSAINWRERRERCLRSSKCFINPPFHNFWKERRVGEAALSSLARLRISCWLLFIVCRPSWYCCWLVRSCQAVPVCRQPSCHLCT